MQKSDRSAMLGTMEMSRLIPKVSLPIMASMLIQALYNVVDSIFVSRFDPNGLTAVSLAFPFQMLMIALSTGMGTGINSLVSRRLGEKKGGAARQAAWSGLAVEGGGSLLFVLFGLLLAGSVMRVVVSGNLQDAASILEMSTKYLTIVTVFSSGVFLAIYFERMLQATGNTVLSMITQMAGAITNIILDPILIFGYLGFRPMGVAGAAIATVIGQWISAGLGFWFNQHRNPELRLNVKECRIFRRDLTGIFAVGFPSTIMQAIGSVMNVGMNAILSGFELSNAALNVMSVYFKLQSFIFMPVFGLSTGIIAIVAYNFGARQKERIYRCIRLALIWAGVIMLAGTLVFMLFPEQLMALFKAPPEMVAMGVVALHIVSLNFPFAGYAIMRGAAFQALGKSVYSMNISLVRQLLIIIPLAFIFAKIGGVNMVWWAFPCAEVAGMTMSVLYTRRIRRTILSKMTPR